MKSSIIALSSFLSLVAAVPLQKRDIVWVTETAEVVETVAVTTTVWVDYPGPTFRAAQAQTTPADGLIASFSSYRGRNSAASSASSVAVVSTSSSVATLTSSFVVASTVSSAVPTSTVTVAKTTTTSSTVVVQSTTSSSSVAAAARTTTSTTPVAAPVTTSAAPSTTSTTSVYVAPTTSAAAPVTTSATPVTTTSAAPASAVSAASGAKYTGDITHYDVGLGSCGWTSTADEAVVAIPHVMMANPANPNLNPKCGKYITISYAGATHQAKIVDTCGGCDNAAIDLSNSLFTAVAPNGDGRVHGIEWWYNN
ncbi:hypothetical protein B0A49_11154 [Cryomyces minteri]|uniref:RlpA-like protein double-psi beta-barrel domain-containing protein n=1 Tax=Cryomyces minteri TaxID=331657 RepID=A0A4U0WP94_9PEZI|nr:hypothetical protein B0A49_11154 [Cryomyces minteri]